MDWLKGLEAIAGLPLQVLLLAVVVILWRKVEEDYSIAAAGGGAAPLLRLRRKTSGSIPRKLHVVTLNTSSIAPICACCAICPAMIAIACGSVGNR